MKPEFSLKTRRDFLRTTTLGTAFTWTVPTFLAHTFSALQSEAADKATQIKTGRDGTILVVLQMAGGNDGLNTVIPYENDHYSRARSRLRFTAKETLKINDTLGFHPNLAGFKALYDSAQLCVVQGIGYPNPNRSHFRSTEIWHTASDANTFEKYGWIGRYFDNACAGCDPTIGINIGRQMPQAFSARRPLGVSLDNPQDYRFVTLDRPGPGEMDTTEESFRKLNTVDEAAHMDEAASQHAGSSIGSVSGALHHEGSVLDFIERTALDAQLSSDKIRAIGSKIRNQAAYPNGQLANSLQLVARLIAGGLPTRIYYVSQGGYDTHTNQAVAQDRLLNELGDSLKAFLDDLKAQGHHERVMVMTFSEFGRRVQENANGGTDHGAASVMFLAGARVKAGLAGTYPSLAPSDLMNGDLKYTTEFRSVYAGVLERWLKAPSAPILGRQFPLLDCLT
jgi:uncharacterized protein (DUF1501 family)